MKRALQLVEEFHLAFGAPVLGAPKFVPDRSGLRISLILEEAREFSEAATRGDLVEMADALGDLAYVIAGAALEFGIPLDRVLEEIHRSNMSKLGADGKPIYREDGKVMKGPNYTPPDIEGVLYGNS